MQFDPTTIDGVWLVRAEPSVDRRGAFVRFACERTLTSRGLVGHFMQTSLSISCRRGTLRGMHYQAAPHGEVKLVRCIRGSIHDVVVDLPESPTYLHSASYELSSDNQLALYIPEGCAHGLLTLEDDCHVLYQIRRRARARRRHAARNIRTTPNRAPSRVCRRDDLTVKEAGP